MSRTTKQMAEGSGLTMAQVKAEFKKYKNLRIAYNAALKGKNEAEAAMKAQAAKVRRIAESEELHGRISYGTDVYEVPEPTWYATVQDFDAFMKWARENDQEGMLRLDKRVSQAMNDLVRERIEDGEPLPPGLGSYPKAPVKVFGLKDEE